MYKTLLSVLLLSASSHIQAMTVNQYLSMVSNNHPEIAAIDATSGQYRAEIQFADGAYDSRLDQTIFSRAAGFYDGLQASQRVSKPIEAYNAEIFSEYRVSNGEFPVYEQEYETLSGGEVSVGIKFSLLQGRETDKDRTAITSARLKYQKWLQEARLAQSEFYYSALLAYLDWVEAVSYYQQFQKLVEITKDRQKAITTKVEEGELARIALLEVETRLLERQASLLAAERKVHANEQKLRYYIQDSANNTAISSSPDFAESLSVVWPNAFKSNISTHVSADHPALNAKAFEMEDLQQYKQLAEVDLLPKLDVEAKLARDLGNGSRSLQETDAQIGLSFSVPFNRTQAKANKSKIQFEISTLIAKTEALRQSINAKLEERAVNLSFAKQLDDMQKQQVSLSRKLFQQEQRQFELAASDFFILNNREEDAFQSELKALTTQINIYREELMLLKLNARLDHSFIQQTLLH